MPILFQISAVINSGSVGRIADQIGQTVIRHGWQSYISYARNCLTSMSEKVKIGNKLDIYWHGINSRLFDNHCLCSTKSTKKLIRKIKEIRPDVIHIHNLHGYYINMKILFDFLKKADLPVVWTLHDCWSFTGHCTYFDYIKCKKWVSGCYRCPQKRLYPASFLFDRSSRNYKIKKEIFNNVKNMTIVPVSYWLGELVKKSFLKEYPIKVIQNGIDTNCFFPVKNNKVIEKYNIGKKIVLLGVSNQWTKRKGFDDFIALNKVIDHTVYKIVLVGLNNKQLKELPDTITGIKHTENVDELAALYSISNIYINPTLEDNFPTTNLEAMACGTPVITYRTGGSIESISENTGLIVNREDINGLYKAVEYITGKGKNQYTDNCRSRAILYYDKQDRFNDYIDLYNTIIIKGK